MNNRTENKPRLLDQVRDKLRLKHYSYRTEQSYIAWMKRFIFFHNKQHPDTMGEKEIEAFLTRLPVVLTILIVQKRWINFNPAY